MVVLLHLGPPVLEPHLHPPLCESELTGQPLASLQVRDHPAFELSLEDGELLGGYPPAVAVVVLLLRLPAPLLHRRGGGGSGCCCGKRTGSVHCCGTNFFLVH